MTRTAVRQLPGLGLDDAGWTQVQTIGLHDGWVYLGLIRRGDGRDGDGEALILRATPGDGAWQEVYSDHLPSNTIERDGRRLRITLDQGFGDFAVAEAGTAQDTTLLVSFISIDGSAILRSADGVSFDALPNDSLAPRQPPLGRFTPFADRLFALPAYPAIPSGGQTSRVDGPDVYVADDLASGAWSAACEPGFGDPANLSVNALAVFEHHLYAAAVNLEAGFSLWRTDASGDPPYAWEKVLDQGAYRYTLDKAVGSLLATRQGLLLGTAALAPGLVQVGTFGPEIIQVGAEGSWEVVVGTPRFTPDGLKVPLSAQGPGFDRPDNAAITHLAERDGMILACQQDYLAPDEQAGGAGSYAGDTRIWVTEDLETWRRIEDERLLGPGRVTALRAAPCGLVLGRAAPDDAGAALLTLDLPPPLRRTR